jgi:hypothetical protein
MGELIEHVEHPILASIVGPILDEVIGPDMIAVLRQQPNARSVGQPEPAALGLLMGDLQLLALPDKLDPLVIDYPARLAQQFGDLAIAIAAVLPGRLDSWTMSLSSARSETALRSRLFSSSRSFRRFTCSAIIRHLAHADLADCVLAL